MYENYLQLKYTYFVQLSNKVLPFVEYFENENDLNQRKNELKKDINCINIF